MILGCIGVDLNGGLINHLEGKRRALQHVTNRYIGPEWFPGKGIVEEGRLFSSMVEEVPDGPITSAHYAEAMRLYYETDKFFEWSEPMPGALEVLHALSKRGCEIRIISSVLGLEEGRVWALVQKYRLPVSQVIATRKKPKTQHYEECDAVVDNEMEHLVHVGGRTVRVLLVPPKGTTGSRCIGRPMEVPKGILVAVGWAEVASFLLGAHASLR